MLSLWCLVLPTLLGRALGVDVPVSVPVAPPSTAYSVSPTLVGLSIEQDRWTDWVGATSRNQYFYNLLDNLRQLTGHATHIRIGADSEDHTDFRADIQSSELDFPNYNKIVPYPEATTIIVGDAYYQAVQFLPPNTHVTWGLNFGQNNLTAAFLEAKSIFKAFASQSVRSAGIKLDALEIGNEADLYSNHQLRPKTYNIGKYVQEWTAFATNISQVARITANSETRFWACAFAESTRTASGFSPQSAFAQGLLSSAAGAGISTISQHHYSGSFCSGNGDLLQNLMTKSTIRNNLLPFIPDMEASHAKGLDYILGETNSYSCHGAPGVSNTAGAALWALDYILYATQVGISRVFFHEGVGYKYNLIQPVTLTRSILDGSQLPQPLPPHIHPQYYAAIVAGEAIGSSGKTRVAELAINNTRIAGYAFYEGQKLVRAVFINSGAYLKGSTAARTSVHLKLTFSGIGGATLMTVKRLSIGFADDTKGLTWGGQNYETSDGKIGGNLSVKTVPVAGGVDIAETEVVLLSFP